MSMTEEILARCSVCGEESYQIALASFSFFDPPDLDSRPSETLRGTMQWWIQECPRCGYVAKSIEMRLTVPAEILDKEDYKTCDGIGFRSPLAKQFYRRYLLCLATRDREEAYLAALHAAWACDDAGENAPAVRCRKAALDQLEYLLEGPRPYDELYIEKADLLRRAGEFDRVAECRPDKPFTDGLLNDIMAFEIARAKERDDGCYTVDDVKRRKE